MIEAKKVADSVCQTRITSLRLKFPKSYLAEFNTHRAFSRNASSSRAIPTNKLLGTVTVEDERVYPVRWGKNQAGMQASGECLSPEDADLAKAIWDKMADVCATGVAELAKLGLHKQWCNRPAEWFSWTNVLVTSTEWENFLDLRDHPAAQPEMEVLAKLIRHELETSEPRKLRAGEWHLPYVSPEEEDFYSLADAKKMSAARCASLSYQTVDGLPMSPERALALCNKLLSSGHYSPFEHQAMADSKIEGFWCHRSLHANFTGWAQFRHYIQEEHAAT